MVIFIVNLKFKAILFNLVKFLILEAFLCFILCYFQNSLKANDNNLTKFHSFLHQNYKQYNL